MVLFSRQLGQCAASGSVGIFTFGMPLVPSSNSPMPPNLAVFCIKITACTLVQANITIKIKIRTMGGGSVREEEEEVEEGNKILVEIVESGARNNPLKFLPLNLVLQFLWHVSAPQNQFFAFFSKKRILGENVKRPKLFCGKFPTI